MLYPRQQCLSEKKQEVDSRIIPLLLQGPLEDENHIESQNESRLRREVGRTKRRTVGRDELREVSRRNAFRNRVNADVKSKRQRMTDLKSMSDGAAGRQRRYKGRKSATRGLGRKRWSSFSFSLAVAKRGNAFE